MNTYFIQVTSWDGFIGQYTKRVHGGALDALAAFLRSADAPDTARRAIEVWESRETHTERKLPLLRLEAPLAATLYIQEV